ncbi:MAG: hypothetical protein D6688_04965, partial [Alphaproteobacteria bacterium]
MLYALAERAAGIAGQARLAQDGVLQDQGLPSSGLVPMSDAISELETSLAEVIGQLGELVGPGSLADIGASVTARLKGAGEADGWPTADGRAADALQALGALEDAANALASVIRMHGSPNAAAPFLSGGLDGFAFPLGLESNPAARTDGEGPVTATATIVGEDAGPTGAVPRPVGTPEPASVDARKDQTPTSVDGGVQALTGHGDRSLEAVVNADQSPGRTQPVDMAAVGADSNAVDLEEFRLIVPSPARTEQALGATLPGARTVVPDNDDRGGVGAPTAFPRPMAGRALPAMAAEGAAGHAAASRTSQGQMTEVVATESSALGSALHSVAKNALSPAGEAPGPANGQAIERGPGAHPDRLSARATAFPDEQGRPAGEMQAKEFRFT